MKRSQPSEGTEMWAGGRGQGRRLRSQADPCVSLVSLKTQVAQGKFSTKEIILVQVVSNFYFSLSRFRKNPLSCLQDQVIKSLYSQFPVRALLREVMTFIMGTSSTAGVSCVKLIEL